MESVILKRKYLDMSQDEMLTKAELKTSRGWTDSLIKNFAPIADKEYPNPHSKNAGTVKLYSLQRIISLEQSEDFMAAKSKADKRKKGSETAAITRKNNLLADAANYKSVVPIMDRNSLYEKAKQHYEALYEFRKPQKLNNLINPDNDFLNRIATNYLRHALSDYDYKLRANKGKTGKDEAYEVIRYQIDMAIIKAYPFLKPIDWETS